jgi:acetoin utilization protein AcuB
MTPDPVTVEADSDLLDAVRLMRKHKYGGVPVMESGRLVGILTETDLLDFLEKMLSSQREPSES